MKITVIHGIEHKGSTWHMTQLFLDHFREFEIAEFYMPKDMPYPCIGCNSCFLNGEDTCPHAEQVQPIVAALDAADLVVITSPVYLMSMTGQLKQFLDHMAYRWFVHRPSPLMYHKTGVVISNTGGAGSKAANKQISASLSAWGIPKIYRYGIALAAAGWNMVSDKKRDQLARDIGQLADKAKAKVGNVKPSLATRIFFSFFRSMHKKNGDKLIPRDNQYWRDKGWLAKARPWHTADK